ncbi:glutathione synthase ATP binding domain protein [Theileria parva strain Muguga]|uniref:glutathione synthase ATP binding domain protein n=1 Tax=Theileria parva strain Muguga TaxID=333668 RepID=UPI001C620D8D|nr:glutathione synthase ATP binding domain protein [Theileria parva strain Muguga]EAN33509.2 glutathione synthase ATP binding domain protein [Theileria parva strain Muguga]
MSCLLSMFVDLYINFLENSRTQENKLKIPSQYKLTNSTSNWDLAVDCVRYLVFNGGLYQARGLITNLSNDLRENFHLEAYDSLLVMVNFVLFPLPFPLKCYEDCCLTSTILVEIVDEMSVDLELLNDVFSPLLKYDKFVRDLLQISNEVYGSGARNIKDDLRTYICRSDYFIHIDNLTKNKTQENEFCKTCLYDKCLCEFSRKNDTKDGHVAYKLVEINLGACSLSNYSRKLYKVHDKLLRTYLIDLHDLDDKQAKRLLLEKEKLHLYNNPDTCFTYPIYESHRMYLDRYNPIFGKNRVCGVLIPDINFFNFYDTYFISNDMFDKYGVHVKTATQPVLIEWMKSKTFLLVSDWEYNTDGTVKLLKYADYTSKLHPGRLVIIMGSQPDLNRLNKLECFEVSTVYSRDYYDSSEMVTDDSVFLRKFLEFSDAVKIPNTLAQLVNTKRAQMYFTKPENIERLVSSYNKRVKGIKRNNGMMDLVKQTTILQVDPSLESSSNIVKDAIQNPSEYILKPNREIGKGILFNVEISERLRAGLNNKEELCQYVLMKKIKPPSQPALFVKNLKNGSFEVKGHNSLTELGVYHYAIYDGDECIANEQNGYLARTKPEFATGGGLGSGHGFVGTLLLY